jgi:hypothetical protein
LATWGQVTLLLNTMYDVLEDATDSLDVQVKTGGGRTQLVTVRRVERADDDAWVVVESPVARLEEVDVSKALEISEELRLVGLTRRQEFLAVVHAGPLKTLDAQDLARPLALVALAADRLERLLVGQDYL